MMEARTFLQAVAGFTQGSAPEGSATAPVKIGTIDVAYSGTGFAKVKFDGESATSTKAYPFLASYFPVPGDRVVLMPAGNTYVIVGKIDDTVNNLVKRVAALETLTNGLVKVKSLGQAQASSALTLSTTATDIAGTSLASFTPAGANSVAVLWGVFDYGITTAGAAGAVFVGHIVVDGSTVGPLAIGSATRIKRDGTSNFAIVPVGASAHTAKLQARFAGSGAAGTANITQTAIGGILLDIA